MKKLFLNCGALLYKQMQFKKICQISKPQNGQKRCIKQKRSSLHRTICNYKFFMGKKNVVCTFIVKGKFPVSGIFRLGGILGNKRLLSRNCLFIFRATSSPANNTISLRSESSTDWKSAVMAFKIFSICLKIYFE